MWQIMALINPRLVYLHLQGEKKNTANVPFAKSLRKVIVLVLLNKNFRQILVIVLKLVCQGM